MRLPIPTRSFVSWQRAARTALMALLTLAFLAAGGSKLVAAPVQVANFARWELPAWMMVVTGVVEVVGALLLWRPATRLLGALALVATLLGAHATLLVSRDWAMLPPTMVLLILAVLLAWLARPPAESRVWRVAARLLPASGLLALLLPLAVRPLTVMPPFDTLAFEPWLAWYSADPRGVIANALNLLVTWGLTSLFVVVLARTARRMRPERRLATGLKRQPESKAGQVRLT